MTKEFFDPDPDKPYGVCMDCSKEFPTYADAQHHMIHSYRENVQKDRPLAHTISVMNRTRRQRIESFLSIEAADVIEEVCLRVLRKVEKGDLTMEEVRDGFVQFPDFQWEWQQSYMPVEEDNDD